MEASDFETLVTELEQRVDRLRSLYEQYFMGIEKTIPSVPLKDVERRIQALRRDQPRNTGLRFRFQMIIQRYNTYTAYWQRITREIEEGTYKRHLQRAKKKFADVPEAAAAVEVPAAPKPREAGRTESGSFELNLDEMSPDDFLEEVDSPAPKPAVPARPAAPMPPPAAATALGKPLGLSSLAAGKWRKVDAPAAKEEPAPKPAAPMTAPQVPPKVPAPVITVKPLDQQKPPTTTIVRPPVPAPMTAKPAAPPAPVARPAAPPAPVARPAAPAAPAPAAKPAPAAAPPAPRPPAAPKAGDVTDDRMRQIYSQYVQTKRAQNESTAKVTYENLARTIQESSAKLREKHAGKAIDFEVSVKDGKTVLKPVVK